MSELKALIEKMKLRSLTAKVVSVSVTIAGLLVIIDWFFDLDFINTLPSKIASMEITSAVFFLLSGIILFFIVSSNDGERDLSQVVISSASFIIVLVAGVLLVSFLLNIDTGLERTFMSQRPGQHYAGPVSRLCFFTMINFLLVAAAGIMTNLRIKALSAVLRYTGLILVVTGLLAVAGYIFNIPGLYYYVSGKNNAMLLSQAVLFVLLGAGFICQSK